MRRALAALVILTGCNGPLDHEQLSGRVEDLRALAAEAHLLVTLEHPTAFGIEHRKLLVQKIHEARKDLDKGVDDASLEPFRATAAALGAQLELMVTAGADPLRLEPPLVALDVRLRP